MSLENRDQCQKGVPGQENEVHRQVGISALDVLLKKMRTVGLPETLPVEDPAEQRERCVEPEQENPYLPLVQVKPSSMPKSTKFS